MDEPIIPENAAFRIQLPTFEGPLDLLLHLIKKHELDILDLPIAFVTARYLDYLQMMQELDLDLASEYLLMAATLAHIKSKMLLPASPIDEVEEVDDGYQADPRAELIKRLLEYQKYRAAAEELGARPLEGRDVFVRGVSAPEAQGPAPLASIDLYKLLDAFQGILKRVKGRVALEITAERITLHERMTQISDLLRTRRSCTFEELFEGARTRYEVVVTFLALLEMTKLRMTRIYQTEPTAPLHVQYALLDADSPTIPPAAELMDAPAAETTAMLDASSDAVLDAAADAAAASIDEAPTTFPDSPLVDDTSLEVHADEPPSEPPEAMPVVDDASLLADNSDAPADVDPTHGEHPEHPASADVPDAAVQPNDEPEECPPTDIDPPLAPNDEAER